MLTCSFHKSPLVKTTVINIKTHKYFSTFETSTSSIKYHIPTNYYNNNEKKKKHYQRVLSLSERWVESWDESKMRREKKERTRLPCHVFECVKRAFFLSLSLLCSWLFLMKNGCSSSPSFPSIQSFTNNSIVFLIVTLQLHTFSHLLLHSTTILNFFHYILHHLCDSLYIYPHTCILYVHSTFFRLHTFLTYMSTSLYILCKLNKKKTLLFSHHIL